MADSARRGGALLRCLVVLWVTTRFGNGQQQPTAQLSITPDELLRFIEQAVKSEVQPLITKLESRIERLDSRVDVLDSRLDSKLDMLDARMDDMTVQLYSRSSESGDTTARLDGQKSQLQSLGTALEGCQSQLAEWTVKEERQQSQQEGLIMKVDQHTSRLDALASDLQNQTLRLVVRTGAQNSRLDELTSGVASINSRLAEMTVQIGSHVPQLDLLTAKTDAQQAEIYAVEARLNVSEGKTSTSRAPPNRDCSDLPAGTPSGVHLLQLDLDSSKPPVPAYCDLDADGGGWTVFQRRGDIKPRQDFFLGWAAYRDGFGKLNAEFWWGLDHLWTMTSPRDRRYELRVTVEDFDGEKRHAVYGDFRIASEDDAYRLTVANYSGNAGDALKYHNGYQFSTKDRDNDVYWSNCATEFKGAWWYKSCFESNLNGQSLTGLNRGKAGIGWQQWKAWDYSFKASEMKIRPSK